MEGCKEVWMNGMGEWMDGLMLISMDDNDCVVEWMDGRDGWMDGWLDGRMNNLMNNMCEWRGGSINGRI